MKSHPRWLDTAQKEAAACRHPLPWERGARRAAAIARRKAPAAAGPRAAAPTRTQAAVRG